MDFDSVDKKILLKVDEMQKALDTFDLDRVSYQELRTQRVMATLDDTKSDSHIDLFLKNGENRYSLAFRSTEIRQHETMSGSIPTNLRAISCRRYRAIWRWI